MVHNPLIIIFLLAILTTYAFTQQACYPLCTSNCSSLSGSTCQSCYTNFLTNSSISSACSTCPAGMYKDSSTYLCLPCLSTCLSCTIYSICTTCIPGFMLSNNFLCIPGALSSTGWVSKNVSYELTGNNLAASDLAVWINSSSLMNSNPQLNNSSLQSTCSKIPYYTWLGGYSLFGYNTKIIKSSFGLSPHQWANIRFQAVLIDYWHGNTLLVEVDTIDSYN